MRKYRIAVFFLSGLVSGIFLAQGLFVLADRRGGNFGGEMLILPLIFLLIYMGASIGRMFPDKKHDKNTFRHGYQAGRLSVFHEQDVERYLKNIPIEIVIDMEP